MDFSNCKLTVRDINDREVLNCLVALPRSNLDLPITGKIEKIIKNPCWYPTEKTRKAYYKKYGVELPKKILPGDPLNAMGRAKFNLKFYTPG